MLYNAAAGLGLDRELSKVDFPIDLFLVGSNIDAVTEQAESFVTGLTHWRPATDRTGLREPPRVRIELGFIDEFGEARKYVTQTVLFMQEKIDMSK